MSDWSCRYLLRVALDAVAPIAVSRLPMPTMATWGTAAGVFVVMALLARIMPTSERRRLRGALLLMLVWSVTTIVWCTPFLSFGLRDTCELVSLVALALAAVRVGWLLVVDLALRKGAALGISQISRDLAQGALYLVAAIAAARAAGADARALATTGGLVTAGLTFSLQQTLGDLVAGLLLQGQAPFKVGDWIAYDSDRNHIGQVREINWRATSVVTTDAIEITVPNSVLAKALIVNFHEPSLVTRRRVEFVVGYEHPPRVILEAAVAAARNADGVLATPEPMCIITDFAHHGVLYELRYFIEDFALRDRIDSRVRVRLWHKLGRIGVEFAFPRTDLALVDESADRKERTQQDHARRRKAFDRVDFLSPLSPAERDQLARDSRTVLFAAGEVIVREGDKTTELYVVKKGLMAVTVDQGKREIARLGPGSVFGEMALLTGEPRTATVRALEDCVLFAMDKAALEPILAAQTGLLEKISRVIAERQGEIARRQGENDATGARQALRESSLLERMRRFFGG